MSVIPEIEVAQGNMQSPSVFMDWKAGHSLGALRNGYVHFAEGRRDDAGVFELWSGAADERDLAAINANTGGALTLESTNVGDTAAGAGARTVLVAYIEAGTLFERLGLASMNGTTAAPVVKARMVKGVPTVIGGPITDAFRVQWMRVIQAGPANAPGDGNLGRVFASIGATEIASIAVGVNYASGAFWMAPRGFCASLVGVQMSALDASGLTIRVEGQGWAVTKNGVISTFPRAAFLNVELANATIAGNLDTPRRIPSMSELRLRVNNAGGAGPAAGAMSFVVIEDSSDPDPNPELQPPHIG